MRRSVSHPGDPRANSEPDNPDGHTSWKHAWRTTAALAIIREGGRARGEASASREPAGETSREPGMKIADIIAKPLSDRYNMI